jgi:CRP/FNR family transcriptional regulator, cyclic AMP receptor protein
VSQDTQTRKAKALTRVPIFNGLAEHELNFISQRSVMRQYGAGEQIFGEGEPCQGLYVVETGRVKIFKTSAGGREQVLSIDGPGSSVAELPVFDGGNYPASASAVTDSAMVFVSRQDFQSLCMEYPTVALKVLKVVGGRLRRLVGIIEELSFTTVKHRLAALLLNMAKEAGHKSGKSVEFTLPATNQDLAAMIGTVRELVSRNLSRLQAEGIVSIDGRTVRIDDVAKLEQELAEGE